MDTFPGSMSPASNREKREQREEGGDTGPSDLPLCLAQKSNKATPCPFKTVTPHRRPARTLKGLISTQALDPEFRTTDV